MGRERVDPPLGGGWVLFGCVVLGHSIPHRITLALHILEACEAPMHCVMLAYPSVPIWRLSMTSQVKSGYRRYGAGESLRVVVVVPTKEIEAIDQWGIPAGMSSRTSAVRFLLRKGLEAVAQEAGN